MAIRFAAKDEPKSAPAKADKAKAPADRKVEAAAPEPTPSTAETDLFDAAPKTPAHKRKKK